MILTVFHHLSKFIHHKMVAIAPWTVVWKVSYDGFTGIGQRVSRAQFC